MSGTSSRPPVRGEYPLGLFEIDGLLGSEELEIARTVRGFVDRHVRPQLMQWFESATLPKEIVRELGKLGLFGMHLHGYGCAGTSAVSYGLACMELEAGDSGLRSLASVQGSLAMFAIHHWGSEEQKQQWLPRLAAGDAVGCFALTEADYGSNPVKMRTNAKRHGSDWVINGTKMWITNGSLADIATIWAQTEYGIRGFLVPTDTPGFTANVIHRKLSLRASVTSELVLEDVRVPASAQLPGAHGLRGPLTCLDEARFGILFGALGAARDSLETALEYADSRVVFDRRLSCFQLTQEKLANMSIELGKGMLLAIHLGRLKDEGALSPAQISVGKLNNTREALAIARECRTLLGANGITLEYSPLRHAINLETVLTYEGTAEIQMLTIGRALTGQNAFI
ncbi:acyl-CoA dehydrogenase domain-containing protein [Mycobacteroides abscessus subsp. abscessus]|uniref:acyl-CoA dehydrogenase family protein n=1 Tax=Mycobacteroides abscessus TaxID=36809 RepID=UPI00092679A1|nr:acyl-CoA dehydrogenase family protein [Mycobacteroides abscessus]SIL80921.1 acyl-CoA dehydrogenase domain-containing protein [Mycobacteroides abscessus subsp. abscessus]SLE51792.1 acyl-CoA dehydrogenase domain-containing protein [Mycobacteroides abscessus subsp. abscessus]